MEIEALDNYFGYTESGRAHSRMKLEPRNLCAFSNDGVYSCGPSNPEPCSFPWRGIPFDDALFRHCTSSLHRLPW